MNKTDKQAVEDLENTVVDLQNQVERQDETNRLLEVSLVLSEDKYKKEALCYSKTLDRCNDLTVECWAAERQLEDIKVFNKSLIAFTLISYCVVAYLTLYY